MSQIKILGKKINIIENSETELIVLIENGKGKYQTVILDRNTFEGLLSTLEFSERTEVILPMQPIHQPGVILTGSYSKGRVYLSSSLKKTIENQTEPLYIAIPQKKLTLKTIENIQNACGELMEAMGFEMEQKEEPVMGSFFQKSWWRKKLGFAGEEFEDIYGEAKKALILKHKNLPNAEATEKLANAAANFLNSIKEVETVAARFGALIVVKYNIDGKAGLICETLSPELTMFFEKHPQLLSNPNAVFQLFENLKNNPNHFKEVTDPASADNID